jgi:hypothetical protein
MNQIVKNFTYCACSDFHVATIDRSPSNRLIEAGVDKVARMENAYEHDIYKETAGIRPAAEVDAADCAAAGLANCGLPTSCSAGTDGTSTLTDGGADRTTSTNTDGSP